MEQSSALIHWRAKASGGLSLKILIGSAYRIHSHSKVSAYVSASKWAGCLPCTRLSHLILGELSDLLFLSSTQVAAHRLLAFPAPQPGWTPRSSHCPAYQLTLGWGTSEISFIAMVKQDPIKKLHPHFFFSHIQPYFTSWK